MLAYEIDVLWAPTVGWEITSESSDLYNKAPGAAITLLNFKLDLFYARRGFLAHSSYGNPSRVAPQLLGLGRQDKAQ
jgi:hypothetical protein